MDNDNYTYELEQALTKLLDFFEPSTVGDSYVLYDHIDDPYLISEEMAQAVDHANEVMYGEPIDD